jgi:hypothetical protein
MKNSVFKSFVPALGPRKRGSPWLAFRDVVEVKLSFLYGNKFFCLHGLDPLPLFISESTLRKEINLSDIW